MWLIIFEIVMLFKNMDIVKKINSIEENKIKFRIRTRNFKNIFYIFICLLFLYRNIDEIISQNIDFSQLIPLLFFITTIFFIPLMISFAKLLFIESIITEDMIISNEGIFKMEEIQNINRLDERKLYVVLKQANQYAINGTKIFRIKKGEISEIINFINYRIIYDSNCA